MLKLKIGREPEWVDLGDGVEVLVRPVTTAVIATARDRVELDEAAGMQQRVEALTAAVAQITILDWRGVALEDGVTPAPVMPDHIAALLDVYQIGKEFYARVVAPALVVVSEKNVLSPAPDGSSAGATSTAGTAPADARPARGESTSPKR